MTLQHTDKASTTMHKPKPAFSNRLRAWRASKGLTRKQAAEHFGVNLRTLEHWEQGRFTSRIEPISKIVENLLEDGF